MPSHHVGCLRLRAIRLPVLLVLSLLGSGLQGLALLPFSTGSASEPHNMVVSLRRVILAMLAAGQSDFRWTNFLVSPVTLRIVPFVGAIADVVLITVANSLSWPKILASLA